MFILTLIIIFIIAMVVMKRKESAEDKRDSNTRYLGEEFADQQYYKDLAKQQIKKEDMKEIKDNPYNVFIGMRQGWTLLKRIDERTEKLRKEDNNK